MLIPALGLEGARVISLCGSGGKTTLMFGLAREFIAAGERVLITTTTKMAREEAQGWHSVVATTAAQVLEQARSLLPETGPGRAGALIAYSRLGREGHRIAGFTPDVVDDLARAAAFDRILVEADGSARKPLKAPAAHEPVIPSTTEAVVIVAGLNGLGLPLASENLFRPEIWSRLSGLPAGALVTAESLARCVAHPDGLARGSPESARRILFLNQADTPERRIGAMQVADSLVSMPGCRLERIVIGWLLPEPAVADVVSFPASR
jgi:probable selenium-dependent hydroxylase accessory protein YqeC